jgi:hypothetical protein
MGSLLAPAAEQPDTVLQTPRPTPTVEAPPSTVAPAVAPETSTGETPVTAEDESGRGGGQDSSGSGSSGPGNGGPGADKAEKPAKPAKDDPGATGNGPGSNSGKGKAKGEKK